MSGTVVSPAPPPTIIEASSRHSATVIYLHGRGLSGKQASKLVPKLKGDFSHLKWIFPSAPVRRLSAFKGHPEKEPFPSWYDLTRMTSNDTYNTDWPALKTESGTDLRLIAVWLLETIEEEMKAGIPSERIVLGGYSQGCMCTLYALCSRIVPHRLAGIYSLAGFIPHEDELARNWNLLAAKVPVLIVQGAADLGVNPKWSRHSYTTLKDSVHANPKYVLMEGLDHGLEQEKSVLKEFADFLMRVIPPTS